MIVIVGSKPRPSRCPTPKAWRATRRKPYGRWRLKKGCSRALDLLLKSMHVLIWHEARRWVHSACGYENGHYLDDVIAECRIAIFKKIVEVRFEQGLGHDVLHVPRQRRVQQLRVQQRVHGPHPGRVHEAEPYLEPAFGRVSECDQRRAVGADGNFGLYDRQSATVSSG